mgnify:CR=1 FL=1
MTTIELIQLLRERFEANGFNQDYIPQSIKNMSSDDYQVSLSKDGKAKYDGFKLNGWNIYINTVYKHNGTDENKSVDVSIGKFENSCGRTYEGGIGNIRFNVNMGEKAISTRIDKILKNWDEVKK